MINSLFSHIRYGIALFHVPDITLLKANQAYLNFLDTPYNNQHYSIGKKIYEIIPNWLGSASEKIWGNVLSNQVAYYNDEYIFRFERGETFWEASLTPIFIKGNFEFCIEITTEITEKVKYRNKIEKQANIIQQQNNLLIFQKGRIEAIIKSMSDGLQLVDKDYNITFLNQVAKEFFVEPKVKIEVGDSRKYYTYRYGIDGDEVPFNDLPASRIINGSDYEDYILTIERPDKKVYVSINANSINTYEGNVNEAVLCIRDITNHVLHEKEIEEHNKKILQIECEKREASEQALIIKDEFLSIISHELRTPLNVIDSAIQTLNFVYADDFNEKAKQYIKIIQQNTYRQLRLVNNLLDTISTRAGYLGITKKNIDLVFLTELLVNSIHELAIIKDINVSLKSQYEKIIIGLDDEKYERIILNLLSNAIKYTNKGGIVMVNLFLINDKVCIEVEDSGIGIPSDKHVEIFDKFVRVDCSLSRSSEGTVLGLLIVKKFVEALGGSIQLESVLGKGSKFIILLPNEKLRDEQVNNLIDIKINNSLEQSVNIELSDLMTLL